MIDDLFGIYRTTVDSSPPLVLLAGCCTACYVLIRDREDGCKLELQHSNHAHCLGGVQIAAALSHKITRARAT